MRSATVNPSPTRYSRPSSSRSSRSNAAEHGGARDGGALVAGDSEAQLHVELAVGGQRGAQRGDVAQALGERRGRDRAHAVSRVADQLVPGEQADLRAELLVEVVLELERPAALARVRRVERGPVRVAFLERRDDRGRVADRAGRRARRTGNVVCASPG